MVGSKVGLGASVCVELRAAMMLALGLGGCYTRALGPDDSDSGDDGDESSDGDTTDASSTTTPATTTVTATDTGTGECVVDPEHWGEQYVCVPPIGGGCILCDEDPVCRARAESQSDACAPAFQSTLCGPELVGAECCSVVYVEDYGCAGRPFVVDGECRVAAPQQRDDWRVAVRPDIESIDAATRTRLGAAWQATALAEHASVASFARFVLDLLGVGAPSDLVAAAQRAMADEVVHARLAFGLASAYLGRAIGPGPLPMHGAHAPSRDLDAIVRAAIVEGCVGETVSAAHADVALLECSDPAVRRVLATIARDERRHAQIAWQFVGWALRHDPSLRPVVADAFTAALVGIDLAPSSAVDAGSTALDAHGVPGGTLLADVTRTVALDVIAPCFAALLAEVGPRAA